MLSRFNTNLLRQEGFQLIGRLEYRVSLTIWWNPQKLLEVIILSVGQIALVKGSKAYILQSITAAGETWARDLPALHDYFESHFPELRLAFSHFRDVPAGVAHKEVHRRMAVEAPTLPMPTVEQIAKLQSQLTSRQQNIRVTEDLLSLSAAGSDLLSGYMHQQTRTQKAQINLMQQQVEGQKRRLGLLEHLQHEYQRRGSAASYTFSISSSAQFAQDPRQFQDALRAVVKELGDAHRFEVSQKLGGGRLNIQVVEASEPAIVWIEEWFGGSLSPMQMRKFSAAFDVLRKAAESHMIVMPDEPIIAEGHVRHAAKHLAAHVVSDVVRRLDKTEAVAQKAVLSPESIAPEAMPLSLGYRVDETGKMLGPAAFPLTQMVHLFLSGTSGAGKSCLGRVLVEEAEKQKDLKILVLDPRNQWLGSLIPEDRPMILGQYDDFCMKPEQARGFGFSYFAPGLPYAPPLTRELSSLARGRSIVSFKGLDDQERCALAGKILEGVFAACNAEESDSPRLLIVVDEAQLFTRKRVDESAKQGAAQAERAMDKIAREGRKFGIVLAFISQTIRDFGYELASIRQMTTTKIFLRNSDREIEYAADVIGDGRLLVQLATGVALIHNANWGVVRIRVRPPFSKVFELGEAEVRRLVGKDKDPSMAVTADAQRLLAMIKEHASPPNGPLNMSRAADLAGITSKRRFNELIEELEQAGVIRTFKLPERGRPRVIELAAGALDVAHEIPNKV
jgi:hypothetical protein